MQAIVQDTYGSTDVLELRDVAVPTVEADEVLVRVQVAGIDRGVSHLMTGLPYPIRMMGYGLRAPKMATRGRELAGVVEAIGSDVTSFAPGDEVFGIGEGTFAAYAVARADKLALKPANVTFEQAAALSISALTALQAVRDHAKVAAGAARPHHRCVRRRGHVRRADRQGLRSRGHRGVQHLEGGSGRVARSRSRHRLHARATSPTVRSSTTRSSTPVETPRSLGSAGCSARPGSLVIVGGETGGRLLGGFERGLTAMAISPFTGQTLTAMMCSENADDLAVLADLAATGAITPAIDRAYPLARAADAIRHMEEGAVRGKVVITI